MKNKKAIVIGAGIVGLASARALALQGYSVVVFERSQRAVGASIRNFGMVWPVGQPAGDSYDWAIRSRDVWKDIALKGDMWHEQVGSMHVAYSENELDVLEEYVSLHGADRNCKMLNKEEALFRSDAVNPDGMLGALWSGEEVIVDPREAIAQVALYLQEQLDVQFIWGTSIQAIEKDKVYFSDTKQAQADLIVVCSGADFETLYPELYRSFDITKCKLQMMRLSAQPDNWRIGPALCGGLSLLHYGAFTQTSAASALQTWAEKEMPEYLKYGIHVMVSQQGNGELTVGDSHEYGWCPDPFDRQYINDLILKYLAQFSRFKADTLSQSWNGVYAKMTNGQNHLFHKISDHVYLLNALGGAGMTLSFGLAEFVFKNNLK